MSYAARISSQGIKLAHRRVLPSDRGVGSARYMPAERWNLPAAGGVRPGRSEGAPVRCPDPSCSGRSSRSSPGPGGRTWARGLPVCPGWIQGRLFRRALLRFGFAEAEQAGEGGRWPAPQTATVSGDHQERRGHRRLPRRLRRLHRTLGRPRRIAEANIATAPPVKTPPRARSRCRPC